MLPKKYCRVLSALTQGCRIATHGGEEQWHYSSVQLATVNLICFERVASTTQTVGPIQSGGKGNRWAKRQTDPSLRASYRVLAQLTDAILVGSAIRCPGSDGGSRRGVADKPSHANLTPTLSTSVPDRLQRAAVLSVAGSRAQEQVSDCIRRWCCCSSPSFTTPSLYTLLDIVPSPSSKQPARRIRTFVLEGQKRSVLEAGPVNHPPPPPAASFPETQLCCLSRDHASEQAKQATAYVLELVTCPPGPLHPHTTTSSTSEILTASTHRPPSSATAPAQARPYH